MIFMAICLFAWIQKNLIFLRGQNWKLVLLTKTWIGMLCLRETCLDSGCYQKALRNSDCLCRLIKAPWRISLVPCLFTWCTAVFPGEVWRLLSWEMVKREPRDILGDFKNLRNWPNPTGIAGKGWWQLCGLVSLPWEAN